MFSSLRPLDAEVANLVSLSEMKRKVVDANSETLSRTSCVEPEIVKFYFGPHSSLVSSVMPKTTSNSFLSSVKRNKGNSDSSLESAEGCSKNLQLMLHASWTNTKYINDLYYKPSALLSRCEGTSKVTGQHVYKGKKYDDDDDIVLLSVQDDLDKSLLLHVFIKFFLA